jgi:Stress responsive A/B Barrel Domain
VISHIVLFKPRADMPAADRDRVLQALTTAAVDIPAIRSLRVGRRVVHGLPGYEQQMAQDFEYALILEFDDVEGLKSYLAHQNHAALGDHFTASAAAALAYDYEMLELKTT